QGLRRLHAVAGGAGDDPDLRGGQVRSAAVRADRRPAGGGGRQVTPDRRLRRGGRFAAAALVVAVVLPALRPPSAQELTPSLAISMKEAIETLGRTFAARRPGLTLRYNFGASGDLQKQIEAGAPIDVFVSAATRQMDELEQNKLILSDTRRAFARNVL